MPVPEINYSSVDVLMWETKKDNIHNNNKKKKKDLQCFLYDIFQLLHEE